MNKVISFVSSSAVQIYDFHVRYIVQELDCTLFNLSHQISGLFVLKYVIHVVFLIFTARKCGQDWHAYRSGCLRLFNDHKCWVAAKDHCVKFSKPGNSRLISIYSQDENNQIVRVRSSQGFQEGMLSRNYLRI